MHLFRLSTCLTAACLLGIFAGDVRAQVAFGLTDGSQNSTASVPPAPTQSSPDANAEPAGKLSFLPRPLADGLEVNLWGWLGYYRERSDTTEFYWDGQLQLDINKSFGDRLA